ncbi:MAG: DUF4434 domain-containing protein [Nitrospiraceae bacterium]|nr:DUF4434 domain-containing protein [Nitrospiraceae bacterium]
MIDRLALDDHRFEASESGKLDPTAVILDFADEHGLEVYVGLAQQRGWWEQADRKEYLDALAKRNEALAEAAWKRYGKHASFAGWYISQEIPLGDLPKKKRDLLNSYLRRLSVKCKALSKGKPVTTAPFFNAKADPGAVAADFRALFEDTDLDAVLLQDQVGRRGLDDTIERLAPYYRACREASLETGTALWSGLDCFKRVPADPEKETKLEFVPTNAARIARQMGVQGPYVDRFVTRDFFHYACPRRGKAQTRFLLEYTQTFLHRPFYPTQGHSTQIAAGFPYYADRSPESIASELRANGFSTVHYMPLAVSAIDADLIAALHREGIGVWWSEFGNATYSTEGLPDEWKAWEVIRRADLEGDTYQPPVIRFCLSRAEFRTWRRKSIASVLKKHAFDGIDILEPYWPAYPGPASPMYGCFCDACQEGFLRMFPRQRGLPEIVDLDSPDSPQNNPERWRNWLTFRQNAVTSFLNYLVNGGGGIRETAPRVKVCTWSLALTGENACQKVCDIHGTNAFEIARIVKPDLLCLQTHWPDWLKQDLKPDYVRQYQGFIDAIRKADPAPTVMIQADTGSKEENQRGWPWIRQFQQACDSIGVHSSTYYEYFISRYAYAAQPRIAFVRAHPKAVELHFTKRLDPNSAVALANYVVKPGTITEAKVDGNIVTLGLEGLKPGDRPVLTASNIADDPTRRLITDRPAVVLKSQRVRFTIPSGAFAAPGRGDSA